MSQPTRNRHFAQKCAALGLHVFPCGLNKKPKVKWRANSTTSTEQIDAWWDQWPNALPGIDLAKSGHIIIDADRHGGPDGVAAAEQLFAEHGIDLTTIPTVVTPHNGRHYWFRQPTGTPLGNRDKPIRDQAINVRGNGGAVMAPGAQLPDGSKYTQDKNTPNILMALRDGSVPMLPGSLANVLRPNGHDKTVPNTKAKPRSVGDRHRAYAEAALERLCEQIANTAEGSRNIELNNAAVHMGHMIASCWIEQTEVERRLADTAIASGLAQDEINATLRSGITKGVQEPHKELPDRPRRHKAPSPNLGEIDSHFELKSNCASTRFVINRLGIQCQYDCFHDKLLIGGHAIGEYTGELSDHACLVLRQIISEQFGFDPGRQHAFDASVQLCLDNQFDPIIDYLAGLQWDGKRRLETWLQVYLGTDNTNLNRAIGRLALVAMVRRARQPGCKFDQIIVLEGEEGTNKSTSLAVLAGNAENFSDQTILGRSDKEQQELLRGKWVYEIADLTGISKAEIEQVKAFASRTHDRARPAYGRCLVELPRRCVIFATTNEENYLKSQTGNRRFWPVKTGKINIAALQRDRDQLLAEAATIEAVDVPLVLPETLWAEARAAQEQRMEHDPWDDLLANVKRTIFDIPDGSGQEERITTDELLKVHLAIPADRQGWAIGNRLKYVMRRLGWDGPCLMRFRR
jgi:hypothetical protein